MTLKYVRSILRHFLSSASFMSSQAIQGSSSSMVVFINPNATVATDSDRAPTAETSSARQPTATQEAEEIVVDTTRSGLFLAVTPVTVSIAFVFLFVGMLTGGVLVVVLQQRKQRTPRYHLPASHRSVQLRTSLVSRSLGM